MCELLSLLMPTHCGTPAPDRECIPILMLKAVYANVPGMLTTVPSSAMTLNRTIHAQLMSRILK